jgi:AAA15 family ATPase/GTPase
MIQEITIENYKSIQSLSIELGRVTVFIGENGCGKSNILEAIALGSAAAVDKLDNEFLASRGIRVTDPKLMRSAFEVENLEKEIRISFILKKDVILNYSLSHKNDFYSSWFHTSNILEIDDLSTQLTEIANDLHDIEYTLNEYKKIADKKSIDNINNSREVEKETRKRNIAIQDLTQDFNKRNNQLLRLRKEIEKKVFLDGFDFLIFCLELTELKEFSKEGQIEPLGIKGQGLFKYLRYLSQPQFKEKLDEIKEKLELIDWFEDFDIPDNLYPGERTLKIKDRYLDPDLEYFDQKSANEGFLFLLFYFCLFIGEETPKFFAIDNIDSSLNPRLCRRLIQELVELAKKYDKQVILTTHNPAVLDGLDLDDQEQKLYVINRKRSGHTRADQISSPKPLEGQELVPLSEAFLRGYIGGLPKNF